MIRLVVKNLDTSSEDGIRIFLFSAQTALKLRRLGLSGIKIPEMMYIIKRSTSLLESQQFYLKKKTLPLQKTRFDIPQFGARLTLLSAKHLLQSRIPFKKWPFAWSFHTMAVTIQILFVAAVHHIDIFCLV